MKRLTNDTKLGFQDSNKLPSYTALWDELLKYEHQKDDTIKTLHAQQNNTLDDEYDNGFYNGLELVLSILENREPAYRTKK